MLEKIKVLLAAVWNFIKKITLKIINFVKNIVAHFKDPNRLKKLQEDKSKIAVVIKEKLENGDYNVISCLFDTEKNELVDPEEDAVVMASDQLDEDTKNAFGDKEMIILS